MPFHVTSPDEVKPDHLTTARHAWTYLGISQTTFYKLVQAGFLTPIRFSKRLVRYRTRDVHGLVETIAKTGGVL
ncbi:MAG TPA: hypothetical protein PK347_18195 [Burkholderiaceae bacterium]|nr:hypothetical protein [Burkholderiaceae bacterium]